MTDGATPDLVVSDCSLASRRIQKENGVKVMHPIESLADAYGIARRASRKGDP